MKPAEAMLRLEYGSATLLSGLPTSVSSHILGGVCFSHPAARVDSLALPVLAVDMAVLPAGEPQCEIWHSREPLTAGQAGAIRYRQSASLLFGCLSLDEAGFESAQPGRSALQAATEAAYQSIFRLLEVRGYTSLLRVWNYFSGINADGGDMERYRQFNIGRQAAFSAHGRSVIDNVPAACALGTAAGSLNIAFLATRSRVIAIENPRQVSACHYPAQYGPRSPTFARAGLVNLEGHGMLFISGTASIVGHQTLHAGDVVAQTRECLNNIAAVVDEANGHAAAAPFRLDQLVYKVYVRHPENIAAIRSEMAVFLGQQVSAVFLRADICRADLLVEIEAYGGPMVCPASSRQGRCP